MRRVELLALTGGLDAAFAAFHYGADAIYLGLKKFSARAEAENFTLEELDEVTAYAHSLTPARRVFVTINTLIRQDELPELIETLVALTEIGVDAVIVQDLGVYRARFANSSRAAGTARQHADGGAQPRRRRNADPHGLQARRPGPRADVRRSQRHHRNRRRGNGGLHPRRTLLFLQRPVPVLLADAGPQRQPRQMRVLLPRFLRRRRRPDDPARRQPGAARDPPVPGLLRSR